jgi:acyl dehydratase
MSKFGPAVKFFDDFAVGNVFTTQGRTMAESDNMMWAMFTGDMNPMHVDEEYAREFGLFGGRFPAGLQVIAVASGLQERLGMFTGTGLAVLGHSIEYHKAVLLGDTIHVRMTVLECVPSKTKPAGRVAFNYEVIKQDDTVAASGTMTYYLLARAGAGNLESVGPR